MNLTCREVLDFLSEYLDGALPGETVAVFEHHLAVCPECRGYLDDFRATLRATKAAYASSSAQDIPEELVQAILASRRQP
jgi:predicted anti-sigma-YlaC factor YlaD